jgi:hypothetical protein
MLSETLNSEQQVLTIAQEFLQVLGGVGKDAAERAVHVAFIAKGWIASDAVQEHSASSTVAEGPGGTNSSLVAFFARDEKLKPAENAYFCAAYLYSLYGAQAFSFDDLRAVAADAGVVLPDRVDKTLFTAAKAGKKYFQSAGKGSFRFTSHGELYVQGRWAVKPGKLSKKKE